MKGGLWNSQFGFALMTSLLIIVVMIIISTALIGTSINNIFMIGNYSAKRQVSCLAECGINEAIAHLIEDNTWTADLPGSDTPGALKNRDYYVTFVQSPGRMYSVNNLTSPNYTTGYNGRIIPPYSANIICVARFKGISRVIDVYINPGSDVDTPLIVDNDIFIDLPATGMNGEGTFSLTTENSGSTRVHSNYDDFDPAITINGNAVYLNQQKLATCGVNVQFNPTPSGGSVNLGESRIDIPSSPPIEDIDCVGITHEILSGTFTRVSDDYYLFNDINGDAYKITGASSDLPGITVEEGRLVIFENQKVPGKITVEGEIEFRDGAYLGLKNDGPGGEGSLEVTACSSCPADTDGIITGNGSIVAGMDVGFCVTKPDNPPTVVNKINIFARQKVYMYGDATKSCEFSGMIYAGDIEVNISTLLKSGGVKPAFNIYGGIFVKGEEAVGPVPMPAPPGPDFSVSPPPPGVPPPPPPPPTPTPIPTPPVPNPGGKVYMTAPNLNIIYDEDYLNFINSQRGYTNYNISSWTEYTE